MTGEPIRAAVLADTHGVLRPEVEEVLSTCDVVIHAGDFDSQLLYHKLSSKWPLYAVRGNNDRGVWAGGLPGIKRCSVGGVKFIMAHKRQDVPSDLKDVQVVVFGHSHMYQQEEVFGRLWLNPGGCGFKRFTLPLSLAVMTIENGSWTLEPIWLEKGYGTRSDAISQRNKAKESRYEKRQKRYKREKERSVARSDGRRAGESESAAELLGSGEPQAPAGKAPEAMDTRSELFLIARILRLRSAEESVEWIAQNLHAEPSFVKKVCDAAAKVQGADARQILEAMKRS